MNKIELIGRLTRDVEVKTSKSKVSVATLTLAVNRKYAKDGEQNVDFIDCVAFGKLVDVLTKYTKKGMKIAITGSLNINSYLNKEGKTKTSPVVVIDDFFFVDSANKEVMNDVKEEELPY